MLHKLGLICFRYVGVAFLALQYALWLGDNGSRWYELKVQLSQDKFAAKHIRIKYTVTTCCCKFKKGWFCHGPLC